MSVTPLVIQVTFAAAISLSSKVDKDM